MGPLPSVKGRQQRWAVSPSCHSLRTGVEAALTGLCIDLGYDFWLKTLSFEEITEWEDH